MGFFKYLTSKEFLVTLIAIAAITILSIFGLGKWMNSYTHHDEKIEVPHLEKLSLAETQQILSQKDLSFKVIDSASFNPEYPPRSVIEQNPEPGDFVKKGRKIYLTLNPGSYRKIKVPGVLRQPTRQAVSHLKAAGFRIGKKTYVDGKWKGLVKGLSFNGKKIEPGDILPKYSVIDMVIWDDAPEMISDTIVRFKRVSDE